MPELCVVPVFFDLETTNLSSNYGRILCGCIKPYGQPVQTYRCDAFSEYGATPWDDGELARGLRDALENQFLIMGWNSVMFDIKFLNARLLKAQERVPVWPLHKDLLYAAKHHLALDNSRLQTVQEFLGVQSAKTRLDPDQWIRATAGDSGALDYVVDHCEHDVQVLEEVFERLMPFIKEIHR